jgi:DNA polymerase-3 subunit epsilon
VPLDFTAIDFETANGSPASPCAVGLVKVRDGEIIEQLGLKFRPPPAHDWFAAGNVRVHGIRSEDLQFAPSWDDVVSDVLLFIETDVVVAHNAEFDIGVLEASCSIADFDLPDLSYACSLQLARRTYNLDSYGLSAVAYAIGHEDFQHHDALADAEACARVVMHMAKRHDVESIPELMAAVGIALRTVSR